MLPNITIDGRLVADPELRFTGAGKAVCSMRVAASDNKKDDQGNWQDGDQIFINVSLWEGEAEVGAEQLRKGDPVLVTGRLLQREYEHNGEKRTSLDMKFASVGKKITAPKADRQGVGQRPAQAAANDPWATPAPRDEPPF